VILVVECDRVLPWDGLESLSREDLLSLVTIQQRQNEDLKSTVGALTDEVRRLRSQLQLLHAVIRRLRAIPVPRHYSNSIVTCGEALLRFGWIRHYPSTWPSD
jgi:hypothetical protein